MGTQPSTGSVPALADLPVPPGYRFRFEVTGDTAPGFFGDPEQTVLVFARPEELSYPLTVAISARTDVALIGTEGRAGSRIPLGTGLEAIYHDGMWELGSDGQLHWNDREAHSLTVTGVTGWGTIAVRGARSRGALVPELQRLVERIAG